MKKEDVISAVKNHVTGASSAAGIAVGFAGGMAAQSAMASDQIDVITPTSDDDIVVNPTIEAEPQTEPEVEVISYERITLDGGSEADVAVVAVDGEGVMIVDYDLDGTADMLFVDANHNGVIDPNEAIPIGDDNIQMQWLQQAVPAADDVIAQNTGSDGMQDYVNNADVNDYMA